VRPSPTRTCRQQGHPHGRTGKFLVRVYWFWWCNDIIQSKCWSHWIHKGSLTL